MTTRVPEGEGKALVSGIPPVLPDGQVLRCLRPSRGKSPGDESTPGKRKKRRVAGARQWSVGDHVDAWVDDG